MAAGMLGGLLVLALTGCAAPPTPQPTPTPVFASEDEAFAAAEATYRAYVDALNQVDLSDPETFEAVYEWTTGEANAEARKAFSAWHADGWVVSGASKATTVEPRLMGGRKVKTVELAVCVDVSQVTLVDSNGVSMVSESRPDVQSVLVTLTPTATNETGMSIVGFAGRDGEPTCQ